MGIWMRGLMMGSGLALVARAQTAPPAAATQELFELGRQLFEDYAPPEVKAEYRFPTRVDLDQFLARLDQALQGGSLDELAAYGPEARAALAGLRALPEYAEVADWLEQRIDEIEGADIARAPAPPQVVTPPTPSTRLPTRPGRRIPHYDLWVNRVRGRAVPSRAADLLPALRQAFSAEGIPPELVWIAEAESSFNPTARSPVGARGLFQFMPATAKEMGLKTFLPDERTDPEKSARAAARYLKRLHGRFGEWPLALAAYNAGEGRVGRLLEARGTREYATIAGNLPAETRMYVPKVLALVSARSGLAPEAIPAPRR